MIYINRRLDYETMPNKRISFQVEVYSDDTGSDRRSAIATVIVEVTDTNDHSPQFDEDVRTVGKQIIDFILFLIFLVLLLFYYFLFIFFISRKANIWFFLVLLFRRLLIYYYFLLNIVFVYNVYFYNWPTWHKSLSPTEKLSTAGHFSYMYCRI